jgi:hypothetical protein
MKRWIPKVGEIVSLRGMPGVDAWPAAKVVKVLKDGCTPNTVYLTFENLGSTTAGKDEIVIHE